MNRASVTASGSPKIASVFLQTTTPFNREAAAIVVKVSSEVPGGASAGVAANTAPGVSVDGANAFACVT